MCTLGKQYKTYLELKSSMSRFYLNNRNLLLGQALLFILIPFPAFNMFLFTIHNNYFIYILFGLV